MKYAKVCLMPIKGRNLVDDYCFTFAKPNPPRKHLVALSLYGQEFFTSAFIYL